MRTPTALVATAAVVLGLLAAPAYACKCIQRSLPSAFAKADAVFSGEITAIEADDKLGATFVVAVDGTWKGSVFAETTVRVVTGNSSCNLINVGAKVGKKWLFTARAKDGVLFARQCDGSRKVTAKVRAVLDRLAADAAEAAGGS